MRNIQTKKIGHQKSLEIELSEFYYRYLLVAISLLVDGKLPSVMPGDGYAGDGARKIGDWVLSMLVTKCVSDNYKMLMTFCATLATKSHYLFKRFLLYERTNIRKLHPSKYTQHINKSSPTLSHQHHDVTKITVTVIMRW